MSVTTDVSDDYQYWDNPEEVTLVSVSMSGNQEHHVPTAKRRAIQFKELAASGGVYTSQDVNFHIPRKIFSTVDPKIGDKVIDEEGNRYTALQVDWNKLKQTWKLTCRNIALVANLRDTISIWQPMNLQDAAAGRVPEFLLKHDGLAARIQEQSGGVTDERGKRFLKRSFLIYLEDRLFVTNGDQVRDEAGQVYEITGYNNPDRIDQLMELQAELHE